MVFNLVHCRGFPRLSFPCTDWSLGFMGPSPGEDKAERIDRSGFFEKTLDRIPSTSTCSEWSKLGDVDHIHPLWIHRRTPWLGSSLLCDRVELPSTSFFFIRSITINGRASSLVWVVLWFFLVADTPSKVAPIPSSKTFPIYPSAPLHIQRGEKTH